MDGPMTSRLLPCLGRIPARPRRAGIVAAAVLCLGTCGPLGASPLRCVAGSVGRSVLVEVPIGIAVSGRPLDEQTFLVEVGAPSIPGLDTGEHACGAVRSVRVVSGDALGGEVTRVIVHHAGPAPRFTAVSGGALLAWPQPPRSRREDRSGSEDVSDERLAPSDEPPPPAEMPAPAERAARPEPRRGKPKASPAAAPEQAEIEPSPATASPRVVVPPRPAFPDLAPRQEVPVEPPPPPAVEFVALPRPERLAAALATELREGPGRRFAVVGRLAPGDEVTVDARSADWLRVAERGWAFAAYLQAPEATEAGSRRFVVEAVQAPLHAGPGGQHDIVAEIYRGQQVVVDEVQGDWAHVRNGGWVRSSVLSAEAPARP